MIHWTPIMQRCLLDWLDASSGDTSKLLNKRSEACNDAANRIQSQLSAAQMDHQTLSAQQVLTKLSTLAKAHIKGRRPLDRLASKGLKSLKPHLLRQQRLYSEEELIDWPSRVKDTSSAHENASVSSRERQANNTDATGDSGGHIATKVDKAVGTDGFDAVPEGSGAEEDTTWNPVGALKISVSNEVERMFSSHQVLSVPALPDGEDFSRRMNDIFGNTLRTVTTRLEDAGIDSCQPTIFSVDLYGPKLMSLLTKMICCEGSTLKSRLETLIAMQYTQRIELRIFLVALVSTAVTQWALVPDPGLIEGDVSQHFFDAFSASAPIIAKSLRHVAMAEYLEKKVLPTIRDRAAELAATLNSQFNPFLVPRTVDEQANYVRDVVRTSAKDQRGVSGQPLNQDPIGFLPEWHHTWMQNLTKIFEKALLLRLDMAKYHAIYRFESPFPGQDVRTEDMRIAEMNAEMDVSDPGVVVMLCLYPIICARVPTNWTDDIDDEEEVPEHVTSPAMVYAYKPVNIASSRGPV